VVKVAHLLHSSPNAGVASSRHSFALRLMSLLARKRERKDGNYTDRVRASVSGLGNPQ